LEMGGYYNGAKLFWGLAFSGEVQLSNEGLHVDRTTLEENIAAQAARLRDRGADSALLQTVEAARRAVQEDGGIPFDQIPQVSVCRTCGELVIGEVPAQCPTCGGFELTFREFPPVHYLEPLSPAEALAKLESAPAAVSRLIDGLTDEEMDQPPAPGEWSIREVLDHLLGAQNLVAFRVGKMLDEDNPSLKAVTVPHADEVLAPREMFAQFVASRKELVDRLRGIDTLDWWRTGVHEEFSTVTVVQQASYFAKHDHAHLTQIEAIRRTIGA